jgi:hypothetical protein
VAACLPTAKASTRQPPCDASRPSQRTARRTPTTAIENPTTQHGSRRGHRRMVRTLDVSAATPASIPRPHKPTRRQPPLTHERNPRVPATNCDHRYKASYRPCFHRRAYRPFPLPIPYHCQRGEPLRTAHHVTVACPLHAEPRRQPLLPVSNSLLISAVFSTKEEGPR